MADSLDRKVALEVALEIRARVAAADTIPAVGEAAADGTSQEKVSQGRWGHQEGVARYKNACDFLLSLIRVCGKKLKCRSLCKHQI